MFKHTNHVCDYITPNYTSMTHRIGIYKGTVALYPDQTRVSVSGSKTECSSLHDTRNNIRNNETRLSGAINYDTFPRITLSHTVLLH